MEKLRYPIQSLILSKKYIELVFNHKIPLTKKGQNG